MAAVARGWFSRGWFWIWLNDSERWGTKPPSHFWMVLEAPGAAQTLKTTVFKLNPKSAFAKKWFSRGGFWIWMKWVVFGVWAAPGSFLNHSKWWGPMPHAFLDFLKNGFKGNRDLPDLENDRF